MIHLLYILFFYKVQDDGKLPRTICPGCNIQLEATVQFLQLLVNGQQKLREMWKHEVEQRKTERLQDKRENMDCIAQYNQDDQYEQQIVVKSNVAFYLYMFLLISRLWHFIQFRYYLRIFYCSDVRWIHVCSRT